MIIGIEWVCPLDAIREDIFKYGWFYRLSSLAGKEPKEYFDTPHHWRSADHWAEQLQVVEDEEKVLA